MKYTPKQIEKYNRQKYITFLEKITKNLFKMFRNEETSKEKFIKLFYELKIKFDKLEQMRVNGEYLSFTKEYIENLYKQTQDEEFCLDEEVRTFNLTLLNRLQKLKNKASYKKDKYRDDLDGY